ncbi:Retrovirus-related Pol polyprotein from type-1 retrotransposable element R2 (Fragment) [Anthophora retusa]
MLASEEDRPYLSGPSLSPMAGEEDRSSLPATFSCIDCGSQFRSKIGLGVHRKSKHPQIVNAEIDLTRRKHRWQEEDMRRINYEINANDNAEINMHILSNVKLDPPRTLESIKSLRKRAVYKRILSEITSLPLQRIPQENLEKTTNYPDNVADSTHDVRDSTIANGRTDNISADIDRDRVNWFQAALRYMYSHRCQDPHKHYIIDAINLVMTQADPDESLKMWFNHRFPQTDSLARTVIPPRNANQLSSKARRRREYAELQHLWRRNQSKAASKVLDGDHSNGSQVGLEAHEEYWRPLFESSSTNYYLESSTLDYMNLDSGNDELLAPITTEEVKRFHPEGRSAQGPDNLKCSVWVQEVPDMIKAVILNIFVESGSVPEIWRNTRTVLIPKEDEGNHPSQFRPISISSVILRHFHRILAARIMRKFEYDQRQRGFIHADGSAENLITLSSVIEDAWSFNKQLHVCFLDVCKAFDSVSHASIKWVLIKRGFPPRFIAYITKLYASARMYIEVGGRRSVPVQPGRGIRQGDPLSSILFNLVMDEVLARIPASIGYLFNAVRINALAFADDLVLIVASVDGLQELLDCVITELARHGLVPAPSKCRSLSVIPSGRDKKSKLITDILFDIAGTPIPQTGFSDTWKHLGVVFNYRGVLKTAIDINNYLDKITKAPLKPQQRLQILRVFLLPRFQYPLVLGRVTYGTLRCIDKCVRKYLRKWLSLPKDVPKSFFHTSIKEGGLGMWSFETKIPELTKRRLENINSSATPMIRAAADSKWVRDRLKWCNIVLSRNIRWAEIFHRTVDGYELRDNSKCNASYSWISDPYVRMPAKKYIENMRTRINALPSLIRTTRGVRRNTRDSLCRAGCRVPETTAHIVQECFGTHGGRILRHDAIVKYMSSVLMRDGWNVSVEPRIITAAGLRKPDLLAARNNIVRVVDTQIVSGYRCLQEAHVRKRSYYADNPDIVRYIIDTYKVSRSSIEFYTATISWKGIWALPSANAMSSMGLSRSQMRAITTRVLHGSYMNSRRFNQMTTVRNHHLWPFRIRN